MIRLLILVLVTVPLPLAAHPNHPPDEPWSIGLALHYVFSFDHYAGTIAVVVGGVGFIAYRNLRRRLKSGGRDKGE